MKFNSQICTSREQSERLLALGLKKNTADMVWTHAYYGTWVATASENPLYEESDSVPAWSLDRLKELYKCVGDTSLWNLDDVNYDRLIQCIGLAIKHNSFNKEYLEE